ncbi:MAG: hypothetical protein IPK96_19940 [Flammeovirgaceae bacterium]|nr:hypothetical protein [Flammeovirgaceae bacterium]
MGSTKIELAQSKNKIALLEILATRRAVNYFDVVAKETTSSEALVKEAAFNALPNVSSGSNINTLLAMLSRTENSNELKAIQSAIISAIDKNTAGLINEAYANQKVKLLPVLPYINDSGALEKVVTSFIKATRTKRK